MKKIRKCIVCGKPFQCKNSLAKYCSRECAGVKRAKKVPKTKKTPTKSFNELVAESDACGMSYGKYKVALKSGKTFEDLKTEYEIQKARELWE